MSEKMITVGNRKFSESTVKSALEKSCEVVFEEEKYGYNTKFVDERNRTYTLIWCHGCSAWYLLCENGETFSQRGVKKPNHSHKVFIRELLSSTMSLESLTEVNNDNNNN